jgi:hypothetical protein
VLSFGIVSENQVELPRGFTDPDQIKVVPDPVHYDSIRIQVHGPTQKQFSLIWSRVRNVNYGPVWYKVTYVFCEKVSANFFFKKIYPLGKL